MRGWDEAIREAHQGLEDKIRALEKSLHLDIAPEDLWVTVRHLILDVKHALEAHLEEEERVFFPPLEQLIESEAGAIRMLKDQHRQLRGALRYLMSIHQEAGWMDMKEIRLVAEGMTDFLLEHEKVEERLLLDVLGFNMSRRDLKGLDGQIRHEEVLQ